MTIDREKVSAAIDAAIGYHPVRVSLSPGVGGLSHRTAEDRDWLVGNITDAVIAHLSTVHAEGETELGGQIVTASFEDGRERPPYCGLEDCECPDHEGSPLPAGTYITVRLDEDHPVRLRRVTVREVTS